MKKPTQIIGGLLAAVAPLSAACDPGPPDPFLGVTRATDGSIQIIYLGCPGQVVSSAALLSTTVRGGVLQTEGPGVVLWRVDNVAHSPAVRFTVGDTTSGFRQVSPMTASPVPNTPLTAYLVFEGGGDVSVDFSRDQLQTGRVFSDGRTLSLAEFESQDRAGSHWPCPSP